MFGATLMRFLPVLFCIVLTACAQAPEATRDGDNEPEIAALTQAIMDLGPEVDPAEAARAARIAYVHTSELAQAYQITDPPLIHNTKVNAGIKPRGLCWTRGGTAAFFSGTKWKMIRAIPGLRGKMSWPVVWPSRPDKA